MSFNDSSYKSENSFCQEIGLLLYYSLAEDALLGWRPVYLVLYEKCHLC